MSDISATFVLCCQLGELCGQTSISQLPGCWEHPLSDDWHLSFNGHKQETLNAKGDPVPAISAFIQHRGGLAFGIIAPTGGIVLGASESELIALLEQDITTRGGIPATKQEA